MKMSNLLEKSVISVAVCAVCFGANAAESARSGRAMMSGAASVARMPTIPTVGLTTVGNMGVVTVSTPTVTTTTTTVTPEPKPEPEPEPTPSSKCEDGGVENSDYTVSACMQDMLNCINTGALQGGLNDLYNEDVRNSIMNGMKLCQTSVDKCITGVRVNCRNVYSVSNDVWLDFNSRIVQPEYYNFVLRKTGLTPNQAENTCLLLDRNTYGASFAAVSDMNDVNTEYSKKVGAYNAAEKGSLSKDNPQGVAVNTVGYDGNRGHYARWDAVNGECLIRVAAYNKDKLITNSWLFGAVGNDNPAEVWQKTGSTFKCNKELFDFSSLLNDTKTAAVIGVGGGAVLGTAIGAAAGAGVYEKKKKELYGDDGEISGDPCDNSEVRAKMANYFQKNLSVASKLATVYFKDKKAEDLYDIDEGECRDIRGLWDKISQYEKALDICKQNVNSNSEVLNYNFTSMKESENYTALVDGLAKVVCQTKVECKTEQEGNQPTEDAKEIAKGCMFKTVTVGLDGDILCSGELGNCVNANRIESDLGELKSLLKGIEPLITKAGSNLNKGKEIGKGAAIGLATGAGVGGIVTGITALVERGNITCKVGDGLNSVALGKAHTIDSLKDIYVKWNLHLPDTVSPTSAVFDRASWEQACSQFNNKLVDCPRVQINFKKGSTYDLIPGACKVSGTVCIANDTLTKSHGL